MYLDLQIYSGLGNIIAIVDSVRTDISIDSKIVLSLYENKGINFDQLIQILPPLSPENDFDVKIYNNDGSLALNCINGARCVSKFVEDNSLSSTKKIKVSTDGGLWHLQAKSNEQFSASFEVTDPVDQITLNLGEENLILDCIDLGNPHGVTFQDKDSTINFPKIGKDLQDSSYFPDGLNFGLANILSDSEMDLRVYERGAGETAACGSGACAAAIIGISRKNMVAPVKVNFQLGSLLIDYKKESGLIVAEGSATLVEERQIEI